MSYYRMIVLHDAHDDTEIRIAAHSVLTYYRHDRMSSTRMIAGVWLDVRETPDEIDGFFDIERTTDNGC